MKNIGGGKYFMNQNNKLHIDKGKTNTVKCLNHCNFKEGE